ncbi:MAG: Uma2 family endonuclease [Bryobacteraceae bacterium]
MWQIQDSEYNRFVAALNEPLLMTVEQFYSRPERASVVEELHWGQLVILSRPKPWHIKLQMKIAEILRPLLEVDGYVITELPFRALREYDLRAADVAFVSKARWDQVGEADLTGAPELVVEILSPSNTKSGIREYAALCLANGCVEFWSVDRDAPTVTVTNQSGQSVVYRKGQSAPVLSGTKGQITIDDIFS